MLEDFLEFLIQSLAKLHNTRQNDWHQQGNESESGFCTV